MTGEQLVVAPNPDLEVTRGYVLPVTAVTAAITRCNSTAGKLRTLPVDLFGLLGMRNLSSFVGELYAASLRRELGQMFEKNPHQDGYPDLLLMDRDGRNLWNGLHDRMRDKAPFSPFATGGVEVKATCGAVPTDAACRAHGHVGKPQIGEQRADLLKSYDWKAHHRDTNNLLGLMWDFIDTVPQIVAVFYCSGLSRNDWGEIVQPKAGGGRTTSVSIMTRNGVAKMYRGWVCVRADQRYIDFINRYNRANLIPPTS